MAVMRCVIFTVMLCMAVAQMYEGKHKTGVLGHEGMTLDVKVDKTARPERRQCCFPNRYEGKMRELVGSSMKGKGYLTGVEAFYAYDAKAKQVAVREVVRLGHKVVGKFKILADMRKKKMYVVNEETKKCTIVPLPKKGSMEKGQCIPRNATHLGVQVLGGSLKTDVYHFGINSKAANTTVFLTVAKKRGFFHRRESCLPVHETAFGAARTEKGKVGFTAVVEFYDIKEKISDPKIFDKPKKCSQASPEILQALSPMMQYMQHKFMGQ